MFDSSQRGGRVILLAIALLLGSSHGSAQDLGNLARELATLRGEVEGLSSELAGLKGDLQDELRTLARQKTELAIEADRERMRLQKIRVAIAQKQQAVSEEKQKSADLIPLFKKHSRAVRDYIDGSLPFRVPERLAELDKLDSQVAAGLLPPPRAITRLWALMEDEFRMTTESGLYRQTIVIEGREQLADVARIGMVMLFFRTSDGRTGQATRKGHDWTYDVIARPQDAKLVDGLFDAFKKQIRLGYFALPNALPEQSP